jgi:hypothetical protein
MAQIQQPASGGRVLIRSRGKKKKPGPPPVDPTKYEHFGDLLGEKETDCIRLAFHNINGLNPTIPLEVHRLRERLQSLEIDLFGAAEVNTFWPAIPPSCRPAELFRSENSLRHIAVLNSHAQALSHRPQTQYGGCMLLGFDKIADRVSAKGQDETGMGRWCWFLFKGKDGHAVRIYSAYRPCYSAPSSATHDRSGTVYNQHRCFLSTQNDNTCPREAFTRDLQAELETRLAHNEKLVVMLDANEDVRAGPIHTMFTDLGLRDAVLSRHSSLPAPGTSLTGSRPIDGIFVSEGLDILKATWQGIDSSASDHRMGILELTCSSLLGENLLDIVRPSARRLSTQNPQAKQQYTRLLSAHLENHLVLPELHDLYGHLGTRLTEPQQTRLTQLDKVRLEGMQYAEKRCRKLRMGAIDFSPYVNDLYDRKQLHRLIWQKKQGHIRSSRRIRRLAYKLKIKRPLSISLEQAAHNFHLADQAYRTVKQSASVHRSEFLSDRKDDPSLSSQARKAARQQLQIEYIRRDAQHFKRLKGMNQGGAIKEVEAPLPPPSTDYVKITDKDSIEAAIAECIAARYRLTENTPMMQDTMRVELGLMGECKKAQDILLGTYAPSEELDPLTQAFLSILNSVDFTHPISTMVTAQDFTNYWRKAREKTSSSISGLHFGHWKSAASNPLC